MNMKHACWLSHACVLCHVHAKCNAVLCRELVAFGLAPASSRSCSGEMSGPHSVKDAAA